MTNYLVVGAGLFGAVFAHEAAQRGHKVKVMKKETMLPEIFTQKRYMVFKFINLVHISSILLRKKFGNM